MPSLHDSIHSSTQGERFAVQTAFENTETLTSRAARFADCATHGKLYLDGYPAEVKLWIHRCGDRLCPLCSGYRAKRISNQLLALMSNFKSVRHMVLTVENSPQGELSSSIAHMRASFAKLRRTPQWREKVRGGAYILEITHNPKKNSWHPHIHILWDGLYFDQRLLSALWCDASDGSMVVWTSAASARHAAYLAKYAGKPPNINHWKSAAIAEYAIATSRSRMLQTFGNMHGIPVEDSDPRPEPASVRNSITLKRLLDAAQAGHAGASQLCRAVSMRWPRLWNYLRQGCDIPPPDIVPKNEKIIENLDIELTRCSRFVMELTEPIGEPSRKYRKSEISQ